MIEIDPDMCIACESCIHVCPCDVIHLDPDTQKAQPLYKSECWYCGSCIAECPEDAITLTFEYFKIHRGSC